MTATAGAFLDPMVGRDVCLLRHDGAPKLSGRLVAVRWPIDEPADHARTTLTVESFDGAEYPPVPLAECERVKFHFRKDRR